MSVPFFHKNAKGQVKARVTGSGRSGPGLTFATLLVLLALAGNCTFSYTIHPKKWFKFLSLPDKVRTIEVGKIVKTARKYVGIPYVFGGSDPKTGFDCSGFTSYVYQKNGVSIPRSAADQYLDRRNFRVIRNRKRLKPGDLVFFETWRPGRSHVGIYVGKGKMLHSPMAGRTVEYASIGNSYWSPKYRGAVRLKKKIK